MVQPTGVVVRRLTWTIVTAIALGSTSLFAAFTASVLVATDLGASRAWAGVPGGSSVLGTAVGAAVLGRVMSVRGRRAGLTLGWAIGSIGGALTVIAVVARSFTGLVAGMVVLGIGHAANQLSRFAGADMYPPARRATVVGFAVWASTVGAVLGPSAIEPGQSLARAIGLPAPTSGFLVATLFFVGALLCGFFLRPDPSELSHEETVLDAPSMSLRDRWGLTHVRIAVVVLLAGQIAMTAIMTMTPLHVREHGHGLGIVGLVMSAHFVGMFAFAPVIGVVVSRIGSVRVAAFGLFVLIVAAVGAAVIPGEVAFGLGTSLFLLGVGWCLTFVSGSALLTSGLAYSERVRLQGSIDALVWFGSGLASLSSGILLATFGYVTLAVVGAVAVAGPLAIITLGIKRIAAEAAT